MLLRKIVIKMNLLLQKHIFKRFTMEVLLKRKAQYSWTPCTNQIGSAPFYIENIINLFCKTSYLNEEINCTEPSPFVSIPWSYKSLLYWKFY